MQFFEHGNLIMRFAVLQDALDDATAIRMSGEDVNLSLEGIYDELDVLGGNPLNRFLHYMVSILIFDTLEDIGLELFDKFGLLISENMFEGLDSISKKDIVRSR